MTVTKGSLLSLLFISALLAFSTGLAGDLQVYPVRHVHNQQGLDNPVDYVAGSGYYGRMKVYMVELDSRWETDTPGIYYHNGFLGFAFDSTFYLDDLGGSIDRTVIWDAATPGYGDVTPENLMAIVVLTDMSQSTPASSDTIGGSAHPFDAYYNDACAAATIDEQWFNTVNDDFTHSVFLEEGTATWCPSCPAMAQQLNYAHDFYTDYPFFYAAMVVDMDVSAANYMDATYDHNWLPTTYFDGGDTVWVGSTAWYNIGAMVQLCGDWVVPGFGLSIELAHLGGTEYEVHFTLTENQGPNQPPPPSGTLQSYVGGNCQLTVSTTDPEGDQVSYRFIWEATDTSGWTDPTGSGEECSASHAWTAEGDYDVVVQARDAWGFESSWSAPATVIIHSYMAGDPSGDLKINILDATYIINYLYKGGSAPNPPAAGDANGDSKTNILDVTHIINYLYKGGPPPIYP